MKYPWMKWWVTVWLGDPQVSLCEPATRGILMDWLCNMHLLDRSGQITGTREDLAKLGRCTSVQVESTLQDLSRTKAADVTVRHGVVTVINRRMRRESNIRSGNKLRKQRERCHSSVTGEKIEVRSKKTDNTEEREREKAPEIPPMSRAEFDKIADMRGVPKDCAEWFWNTHEARDWRDSRGQLIRKVEPLLMNALTSWRSNEGPKIGTPAIAPPSRIDLSKEYDRVIARIKQLSEGAGQDAMGQKFYRPKDKAELDALRARRDELRKALKIIV